jgi:acyl-CoA reductase-like NAD-dependent aldehyde dehydrogenase
VHEFETEEETLRLANGTPHGLDSTVRTGDSGRGRRMAQGIRAASVSVRSGGEGRAGAGHRAQFSYEPQKASGFGAGAGLGGLQSYSTLTFVQIFGA